MARAPGAGRRWRALVWIATFAVTAWLLRGALTGGSLLGVMALALAAGAATGATAMAVAWAGADRRGGDSVVGGSCRSAGRTVAGVAGGLAGLGVALAAEVFTWAAFSGCFIHCDDSDRSPVLGVAFGAAAVASAAAAAWCLGWGLQLRGRTRQVLAAVAGLAAGVLVVATIGAV